jgi:hypothetical protein
MNHLVAVVVALLQASAEPTGAFQGTRPLAAPGISGTLTLSGHLGDPIIIVAVHLRIDDVSAAGKAFGYGNPCAIPVLLERSNSTVSQVHLQAVPPAPGILSPVPWWCPAPGSEFTWRQSFVLSRPAGGTDARLALELHPGTPCPSPGTGAKQATPIGLTPWLTVP